MRLINKSMAHRFIALTLLGYILAIAAAVIAVGLTSAPILERLQQSTLHDQAKSSASSAAASLRDFSFRLAQLANEPAFIKFAIGDDVDLDAVMDVVDEFSAPNGLRRITLYDFEFIDVFSYEFAQPDRTFSKLERMLEARRLTAVPPDKVQFGNVSYLPSGNPNHAGFLVSVPLVHSGLIEGAVVFDLEIAVDSLFNADTSVGHAQFITQFQASQLSTWYPSGDEVVTAGVTGTNFLVALSPDRATVHAIGAEMVSAVMAAVCAFLVLPFGLMSFVGYHSIVTPHRALEASKDQLREQQTEILKAKRDVEYQALHDTLTSLPNRRALELALETCGDDGSCPRTIIRIDLDHFKNVNDTFGHDAGDHVLKEVSRILEARTTEEDMAARVGGDEFVILLPPGKRLADAEQLAAQILEDVQIEMDFQGQICRIGASFGIADAAEGFVDARDLLLGADAALYNAKEQGRNSISNYSETLHNQVVESRKIASEIERSIIESDFVPYFQLQFDAETFDIVGAEALVRWPHPERGVVPPNQFLPIAEKLSVVADIDRIVLSKALNALDDFDNAGLSLPKVSFNVVASYLEDKSLPKRCRGSYQGPTRICFEVLESVLLEEQTGEFQYQVDILKEMGFGIEVDDFGSGHASIIGLMHLDPDVMKIDQRLIFPIVESQSARRLVQSIVDIGKSLGIRITAEGVETREHCDLLHSMGCHTLQGYYFAKPLPKDELIDFMHDWHQARSLMIG